MINNLSIEQLTKLKSAAVMNQDYDVADEVLSEIKQRKYHYAQAFKGSIFPKYEAIKKDRNVVFKSIIRLKREDEWVLRRVIKEYVYGSPFAYQEALAKFIAACYDTLILTLDGEPKSKLNDGEGVPMWMVDENQQLEKDRITNIRYGRK
mgnify:CR=1 FL=1